MSFSASSVHAAATMALVDAMAGMMFFTTPPVSCQVTPCAGFTVKGGIRVGGRGGRDDVLHHAARQLPVHALRSPCIRPGQAAGPRQPPGNTLGSREASKLAKEVRLHTYDNLFQEIGRQSSREGSGRESRLRAVVKMVSSPGCRNAPRARQPCQTPSADAPRYPRQRPRPRARRPTGSGARTLCSARATCTCRTVLGGHGSEPLSVNVNLGGRNLLHDPMSM